MAPLSYIYIRLKAISTYLGFPQFSLTNRQHSITNSYNTSIRFIIHSWNLVGINCITKSCRAVKLNAPPHIYYLYINDNVKRVQDVKLTEVSRVYVWITIGGERYRRCCNDVHNVQKEWGLVYTSDVSTSRVS